VKKKKPAEPPLKPGELRCMTVIEAAEMFNRLTYHNRGELFCFGPFALRGGGDKIICYQWQWKVWIAGKIYETGFSLMPETITDGPKPQDFDGDIVAAMKEAKRLELEDFAATIRKELEKEAAG